MVFLHGLNSDGASWAATAARLQTELAIAPRRPEFGSFQRYEDQANAVQNQLAALPGSTVAVGHSNGGVVARQWARAHDLSGIITIGTPHLGAPLVTNLSSYLNYAYSLSDATNQIAVSFGTPLCVQYGDLYFYCDLNSVGNIVGPALALVDSWHWQALAGVITRLGIDANAPVLSEMRPGSSFLNSLNGQAGREAAEVAVRVGIVSTAHHFSLGGPLRVVYPGQAGDNAAAARDYTALLLRVWAGFIYSGGDYGTSERAQDLADKMMSLSGFLSSMDRRWCYAVSAPNGNVCIENDSVVPVTSQDYASLGAQRIWNGDGPTHFEENDAAGYNNVYEALVNYTHIPQRSTPPPPPPPPPPATPLVADSAVRGGRN